MAKNKKTKNIIEGPIQRRRRCLTVFLASVIYILMISRASAAPQSAPATAAPTAVSDDSGDRSTTRINVSGKPMHISANRSLRDLNTGRLELFGNVYIRRPHELLTADYALIDLKTDRLKAEGNVVYFTSSTVIYGTKMDFNFVTETGVIDDGRVENEKYQLIGMELHRLAEDEYYALDADYTTCRDCPASWKIHGKTIRLTVQGYARVSHMFIKINDAPMLYFPYLLFPVKTKRQSGFLFPKVRTGTQNGFQFVQPYFWAINRSMDATLGFGRYTQKGYKAEAEYRYVLGPRSWGKMNAFYLQDRQFFEPYQDRWAVETAHQQTLPLNFEVKLHWLDASDRDYARLFPEDISGQKEPALVSDFGVSRAGRDISGWVDIKRIKKTLRHEFTGFDKQMVHPMPSVNLATTDHRFLDMLPLHWGLNFNYTHFWRLGPSFDRIGINPNDPFVAGRDPLRRADRYTLIPEIYYTARFFDVLEFMPSVQQRSYFYVFDHASPAESATQRHYLVTQAELATTIERVYGNSIKHKARPSLTYSRIPYISQDPEHPFIKQISYGGGNLIDGDSGRQFDDHDIVPISFDVPQYFVPLGHSLTYKLGNRFITKSMGEPDFGLGRDEEEVAGLTAEYYKKNRNARLLRPSYKKSIDIVSGQTVNFIELQKGKDARPFSRAFTIATVDTRSVRANTELYYYPYRQAFQLSTSWKYFLANYRKRLFVFERSFFVNYSHNKVTSFSDTVSAGITWSLNDYFLLSLSRSLDLITSRLVSTTGRFLYQSPSQCFQIMIDIEDRIDRGFSVRPNIVFNLSGEGFMSVTDPSAVAGASTSAR